MKTCKDCTHFTELPGFELSGICAVKPGEEGEANSLPIYVDVEKIPCYKEKLKNK